MAERDMTTPTADQPRYSTAELNRQDQPASLQYRVQGMKTYGTRMTDRSSTRSYKRGF
jgi:hypothetical protein